MLGGQMHDRSERIQDGVDRPWAGLERLELSVVLTTTPDDAPLQEGAWWTDRIIDV